MRLWKVISSVLLTLCLTLPFAGTWLWLEHAQYEVKEQAEELILAGVPLDDQVVLTFHKAEVGSLLKWEHDREFEFAEEMFDVITREEVGDSLRFWCLLDSRETAIKKQIQALLQDFWQQDDRSQERQQQLLSFGKQLITPSFLDWQGSLEIPAQYLSFPVPIPERSIHSVAPPVPPSPIHIMSEE